MLPTPALTDCGSEVFPVAIRLLDNERGMFSSVDAILRHDVWLVLGGRE